MNGLSPYYPKSNTITLLTWKVIYDENRMYRAKETLNKIRRNSLSKNWRLTLLVVVSLIIALNSVAEELTKDDIRLIVKEENSGWIHVILGFLGAGMLAVFIIVFHYTRHLSNIASDMKEMRSDILTRVGNDLERIEEVRQFVAQNVETFSQLRAEIANDIQTLETLRVETVANIETLESIRGEAVANIGEILEHEEEMKTERENYLQQLREILNVPGQTEQN